MISIQDGDSSFSQSMKGFDFDTGDIAKNAVGWWRREDSSRLASLGRRGGALNKEFGRLFDDHGHTQFPSELSKGGEVSIAGHTENGPQGNLG
jgi:hypothetical protein